MLGDLGEGLRKPESSSGLDTVRSGSVSRMGYVNKSDLDKS